MRRGVHWGLVSSCLLLALAGCARMWFAEREPWRREAEVACLQSGAVKESPSVTFIQAIDGPGVCGADYPIRVAALGEPALVGFADEVVRPPGSVPTIDPINRAPAPYRPVQSYPAPLPPAQSVPGEPISIAPPGRSRSSDPTGSAPPYSDTRAQLMRPQAVPLGRPASPAIAAGPAAVSPAATLACPLVATLDRFVSVEVQPAALRWFGQPVAEIRQISAYSCRGMNGDPNARISEHAFGNALDIAAFTLADGRKITVKDGWHGAPDEQGFLHDVQGAACDAFTTVLAPGSNAYHYDHMHVDLMRRAGGHSICEPTPIPGQVAAARAASRLRPRAGEPAFTGSVGQRRSSLRLTPYADDDARRGVWIASLRSQ
jgi:hypothetical protein